MASMTYSYFGFSCTHCETLKIDPKQNHSPVHTTKKNSQELTFLFFLRSNWTTLWDWDAGSEGGMVWVVTSPRPRPTNNFQILTNKNFWISENYQLAIFYFVDTSCFIGAQPLALMTANGLHRTQKKSWKNIVQASHRELIISHWIVWLSWH